MKPRIKILQVCDKFGVKGSSIHGVSRLFSWWLPRFDATRFDVKLVGLRPADKSIETLSAQGIEVINLNKGKFDPTTLWSIVNLIRRERPEILHLHGYGATVFGIPACLMTRKTAILHEHFVDPKMPKYQSWVDFFLCRYVNLGVANCEAVKEFMIKKRYVPRRKVRVLFNGIPLNEFQREDAERVAEERSRWRIPDGYGIIASIGRLDEQKGNVYLIEAAKTLIEKGYKLKLMLVGDGPLMTDLKKQCQNNGIADDVIFAGHQSNISLIQSMIDIQVFPSLWEGTTLTVFEAMAVGLPIVSTDVDGLGEVLADEKNALLVPAKNAEALASAIERIMSSPQLAARLARGAKEESQRYDVNATVKQLESLYEELAA